jgi:hypothetical protein
MESTTTALVSVPSAPLKQTRWNAQYRTGGGPPFAVVQRTRDHAAVKSLQANDCCPDCPYLWAGRCRGAVMSVLMEFDRTPAMIRGVISVVGAAVIYKARSQRSSMTSRMKWEF